MAERWGQRSEVRVVLTSAYDGILKEIIFLIVLLEEEDICMFSLGHELYTSTICS